MWRSALGRFWVTVMVRVVQWCGKVCNEQETAQLATQLAAALRNGVLYLQGDLGAGKTTLTRYWLQALGHVGAVKSPTYTLVEPYCLAGKNIYHFDLYRLNDPYELELMGIRDYLGQASNQVANQHTNDSNAPQHASSLLLIEWPSKGEPVLPPFDWQLDLVRLSDQAREVRLTAQGAVGESALAAFQVLQHAAAGA